MFFDITPAGEEYIARSDGATLTRAQSGWPPPPGRHRAERLDRLGAVLDQTRFEVRGAH